MSKNANFAKNENFAKNKNFGKKMKILSKVKIFPKMENFGKFAKWFFWQKMKNLLFLYKISDFPRYKTIYFKLCLLYSVVLLFSDTFASSLNFLLEPVLPGFPVLAQQSPILRQQKLVDNFASCHWFSWD